MKIINKLNKFKLNNSKFLSNVSWMVFDKIFQMMLSLVIIFLMTDYLGKSNYGILSYSLSFVNIFTSISKLGIDAILINELIKPKSNIDELIGSTILLRMVSGLLSIILTGISVAVLRPGNTVILVIAIIQGISLLFIAFDTIDYYFQSILKSKYTTIAKSISYILVSLFRLILIIFKVDLIWFAIATVIDAMVMGFMLILFYLRKEKRNFKYSKKTALFLLKSAKSFILANVLVIIYTEMDKIMIGTLSIDSEVGLYTFAMNLSNIWAFFPLAIIDSARPLIMGYKKENNKKYISRYGQLTTFVIWSSIIAGFVIPIFAQLGINTFLYEYTGAISILIILLWSRLFSLLGVVRGVWLICENKGKYVKWFVGIGALINVTLNFYLIPQHGGMGAAVATLITEIIGAIVLPVMFKDTRPLLKIIGKSLLFKSINKYYNR